MRLLIAIALTVVPAVLYPPGADVIRSVGGLAAHLAGAIDEISACQVSTEGDFLIFDRRAHTVYSAAPNADALHIVVRIGMEPGRILRPSAFDSSPDGTFVIADSPDGRPRIQFFLDNGEPRGGFTLSGRAVPQITLGDTVLSGIGSLTYTGHSLLVSQPEIGALVTEYSLNGDTVRTFGDLRPTGQESDHDVHVALNGGIALTIPQGGYYFVFASGVPMFRKYDAQGRLIYERHVEGIELDPRLQNMPTSWQKRRIGGDELPIVPATVRTAAVDPEGNLWISLALPYTYVYDSNGDKQRTVQFRAAGVLAANGLFFTKNARVLVAPGCYLFPRSR